MILGLHVLVDAASLLKAWSFYVALFGAFPFHLFFAAWYGLMAITWVMFYEREIREELFGEG